MSGIVEVAQNFYHKNKVFLKKEKVSKLTINKLLNLFTSENECRRML